MARLICLFFLTGCTRSQPGNLQADDLADLPNADFAQPDLAQPEAPDLAQPEGTDLLQPEETDLLQPDLSQPDLAPPVEVHGTLIVDAVTPNGTTQVPINLSSLTVEALQPAGGGAFVVRPGTGTASGTFEVPNVPAGPYWLHVGQVYLFTSQRVIDLGYASLGRTNRQTAWMAGTQLAFDVGQMESWQASDRAELFSPNAGAWADLATQATTNPPAVGATTFAASFDWQAAPFNFLLDTSQGDSTWLTQLAGRTSANGASYLAAVNSLSAPAFTMTNGATTTISGNFTALQQNSTASFDWKRSQYDVMKTMVHPSAGELGQSLEVAVLPEGAARGLYFPAPANVAMLSGSGTSDLDVGSISFGDPFPAGWTRIAFARALFTLGYTAPGATTPYVARAQIGSYDLVGRYAAQPTIGPPLSVKLDGNDATLARSGIGTTPTLAWSAPSLGTPTGYQVVVFALGAAGSATTATVGAAFFTKETEVPIPPGVLQSGKAYYFMVRAQALSVDLESAPQRMGLPFGAGDALTGMMTP